MCGHPDEAVVARGCINTVTYITVLSEFSRLQPESCDLRSMSAQIQATGAVQQGLR